MVKKRCRKSNKKRSIKIIKSDFQNRGFEVKIDFNKSSKAWGKNKIKIFSPNGFCIGYVYKK